MSDVGAALMVAIKVHAGQTDKQGEPYLLHVLRVVEAVSDEAKVVAALHDVIEDGGKAGYQAVLGLDIDQFEAEAVRALTRDRSWSYERYIHSIAYGTAMATVAAFGLAREVKIADLRDNVGRIPPEPGVSIFEDEAHADWQAKWAPLKRRYEQALQTLGAPVSETTGENT